MKEIVILSGAGISAESGLKTFRDSNGLWENHRVEDVATPEAFEANPELVLHFYNLRRKAAAEAQPNAAHFALKELENHYQVTIITQNVDDLHERAGSENVLHLHGQLNKARSVNDPNSIFHIGEKEINVGDLDPDGYQLRPHIVWFGEAVPMMEDAIEVIKKADIVIVVGTSLQVYPAANLVHYAPNDTKIYLIDPKANSIASNSENFILIPENASIGVPKLVKELIN